MTQHITQEQIRAAGGIVHRDGNIFFTNIDQLNAALEYPAEVNEFMNQLCGPAANQRVERLPLIFEPELVGGQGFYGLGH